jgi:peptidoglycan/xylan/chitin deacetylase (PgdA/CDA1 family)
MQDLSYRLGLGVIGIMARLIALRRPTIFCFHSVMPQEYNYAEGAGMAVSVRYLEKLITHLRELKIDILPMPEAVERIRKNELSPFVVFTFDDGYRDNYEILFPMMLRLSAPFTVFVTTGLIDRTIPMWWEVLNKLAVIDPGLAVEQRTGQLADRFRSVGAEKQRNLLSRLASPISASILNEAYDRSLSWAMLREMSASGLVTLGSHTQHHPLLANLNVEQIRSELEGSRQRMENELGIPIRYVAYPYGQPAEVGGIAKREARKMGFDAAFSTISRPLEDSDSEDMYELPRVLLASKAQTNAIAMAYMSGIPHSVKRELAQLRARLR